MAHWNEIRDAYLVELMRGIKDLPQELVDPFEQTGDIIYFAEICDSITRKGFSFPPAS
jgi:hypothetical protein